MYHHTDKNGPKPLALFLPGLSQISSLLGKMRKPIISSMLSAHHLSKKVKILSINSSPTSRPSRLCMVPTKSFSTTPRSTVSTLAALTASTTVIVWQPSMLERTFYARRLLRSMLVKPAAFLRRQRRRESTSLKPCGSVTDP